VSNDNPFSESLFRTVKYRPDYPRRPFQSLEEACLWVCAFVDWYNHQHRHSGIRFVTPDQHHSGQAKEICRHLPVSTSRPVSVILAAGAEAPAADDNPRWFGSIHHHRKTTSNQLSW
jgi:hypothetical protein